MSLYGVAMAVARSAGALLFRFVDSGRVEVLLGHPGGPFWARRDDGAWSIPKGEYGVDEEPWVAAGREFEEELGAPMPAGRRGRLRRCISAEQYVRAGVAARIGSAEQLS
jgi:predicted NUDIX family NTP pyrophosphohydrolase